MYFFIDLIFGLRSPCSSFGASPAIFISSLLWVAWIYHFPMLRELGFIPVSLYCYANKPGLAVSRENRMVSRVRVTNTRTEVFSILNLFEFTAIPKPSGRPARFTRLVDKVVLKKKHR